jgi:recombination protein RecA
LAIDSAAALVPGLELVSGIGESGLGLHSRVLASGLRRLARTISNHDTVVVFLNQTRSKWQRGSGQMEASAAGPPLKMFAALRVALAPAGAGRVCFRIRKNKGPGGLRETLLRWKCGSGFLETP